MKTGLDEINETLKTAGQIADDLVESGEERQEQLSARHERDMVDGTWLTKNIRPVTLLALLFYWLVLIPTLTSFGIVIPEQQVEAVEMLSLAAFTFYFGSRGFEKTQLLRTRADIKQQRREERRNRR